MKLSEDFRDLIAAFEAVDAKYLLIGGYAVSAHTKPRSTKDIDIWIGDDPANARLVAQALEKFGAPARAVRDIVTCGAEDIVWFGNPPGRVDIFKRILGVEFQPAYRAGVRLRIAERYVTVISVADLIDAKRAAGRPQDLLDLKLLEAKE